MKNHSLLAVTFWAGLLLAAPGQTSFGQTPAPAAAPAPLSAAAATQSASSFAPSADKPELWHLQIYRVKSANMTEFISFIKHEMNPARLKGGMKRLDYWTTVYGNTTELISISPMPEGYAEIGQPTALSKALGEGAANALFSRFARFYEERLNYVVSYSPTLSFTSAKFQGKPDWAIFNLHEFTPGQTNAYNDWRKTDLLPAARQVGELGRWFARMRLGGDFSNTAIEIRLLAAPTEIDQNLVAGTPMRAAMDKFPPGANARQERRLMRYRPDISLFDGKPVAAN